jgi:hypothetical protein
MTGGADSSPELRGLISPEVASFITGGDTEAIDLGLPMSPVDVGIPIKEEETPYADAASMISTSSSIRRAIKEIDERCKARAGSLGDDLFTGDGGESDSSMSLSRRKQVRSITYFFFEEKREVRDLAVVMGAGSATLASDSVLGRGSPLPPPRNMESPWRSLGEGTPRRSPSAPVVEGTDRSGDVSDVEETGSRKRHAKKYRKSRGRPWKDGTFPMEEVTSPSSGELTLDSADKELKAGVLKSPPPLVAYQKRRVERRWGKMRRGTTDELAQLADLMLLRVESFRSRSKG